MNTRDMILKVAFQGFLADGFEKVSLNELIKRTGLTKGAFYYHFDSKDELLREILQKYFHAYIEQNIDMLVELEGSVVEKVNFSIESITNVQERIKEICSQNTDPKAFLMLFYEGLKRDEQLREHNLRYQKKALTSITTLMEQGQASGEIRQDISAKQIATLFQACIRGSMFDWVVMGEDRSAKTLRENMQTFLKTIMVE